MTKFGIQLEGNGQNVYPHLLAFSQGAIISSQIRHETKQFAPRKTRVTESESDDSDRGDSRAAVAGR